MDQSKLDVIVRDYDITQILRNVTDWDALTLIAAVSADPRSIGELGLSWLRYRPDQPLDSLNWDNFEQPIQSADPVGSENADSHGWLFIDLACLRLESNVDELIPYERTAFRREEGKWEPENPVIWINLPPSWTILVSKNGRPHQQPAPVPVEPVDFRGVLFGRAMSEHFATKMIELADAGRLPDKFLSHEEIPSDASRDDPRMEIANCWYELTKVVHADWLMTERSDLGDESPRVFLHRHREWTEWEEEHRKREWSNLNRPPRPLDRNTHTYRYGPMHREEVVIYFDMCREVISFGWRKFFERPTLRKDANQFGAIMYDYAQHWLKEGSIEGDPTPPAEMIESSRRHMPRLADGTHLDCECPLCRMMIDDMDSAEGMFYPTFSGFDGHHLEIDGEFAFSLHETRAQFDEAEAEYQELSDKIERERIEREARIARGEEPEEISSIWSSYVNPKITSVNIMGLGFRLAELIVISSLSAASIVKWR